MKRLLLHTCCAPCSAGCIEKLKENYEVTLFFSNSNIFPKEEFEKRLKEAEKLANLLGVCIISDDYSHDKWREFVKGLEEEPEKGKRCEKCFEFNLSRASDYAEKNKFDFFTTTLTISPHKESEKIFKTAKKFLRFLKICFKNEFMKSIETTKKHGIYRQSYCGCEFSLNNSIASPKE